MNNVSPTSDFHVGRASYLRDMLLNKASASNTTMSQTTIKSGLLNCIITCLTCICTVTIISV
jgi:hypothetical protein